MLLAMFCSSIVLPVRGGATIRAALSFADRHHHVEHPRRQVLGVGLQRDPRLGIERRQVFEEHLLARPVPAARS